MIYFTSDMHLGHRAVIHMQNRPFADVDEMNRTIITRQKISPTSTGGEYLIDEQAASISPTSLKR